MSIPVVTVEGIIKPDGTVEVAEKVELPAGKVQVTLVPWPELPKDDPFWQAMRKIWDCQKAHGYIARTASEVESERKQMREEWDERMSEITRVQDEADQIRGGRQPE